MRKTTKRWQRLDASHHLHPFSNLKVMHDDASTLVIERAEGVYIYDSDDNKILDGMSGLWCVNMGYGQKEMIEAANSQMLQLPYYNSFFKTTHPPVVELSALLTEVSPPQFNQFYFTGSGSESNDTIVRMARFFWASQGKSSKSVIISRENAYHGSTMAGASLGGMQFMHAQGGLPIPDIVHIAQPYAFEACVQAGGIVDEEEVGRAAANALADKIDELGEQNVAAFIAEPVQGAGGVIIPPKNYWPAIQKICHERNILLIADEVICGFGRMGEWFGSDYFGIQADLIPIAKGLSSGYLPIGAVMVSDRVANVLLQSDTEFAHGFTYSGHPVCAAVAVANIKLMQRTKIIDQVRNHTAPYFTKKWQSLASHPLVGEARCVGMFGALELVADKTNFRRFDSDKGVGNICRDICFANGVVMRAVGDKMIICPPLIIQDVELDELHDKVLRSLDQTAETIGINA